MTRDPSDGAVCAELTAKCAIVRLPAREYLEVTGEDRLRFVNGLVTCDVKAMTAGHCTFGFFTSVQGRVLADVLVSASAQSLLLDLPGGTAGPITEHMLRYKVADRVEIERRDREAEIVLAGPASDEAASAVLDSEASLGETGYRTLGGGTALHREKRLGIPALRISGEAERIGGLEARLTGSGIASAGSEAVSAVRIERGVPWFGVDYGDDSFPLETGLEDQAVSYTKGCYLGQEIVARIHYRGRVSRRIVGLSSGNLELSPGAELLLDGDVVGRVTSAAWSSALGGFVGLGMVHRKASDVVALAGGEIVKLAALPFV